MNVRLAARFLALLAVVVPAVAARGDEGASGANLRESWLADEATVVSVPLSNGTSLVVGLPAHLWIQGPRNSKSGITTFDGDGVVLQDIIDMRSGNSHSVAYVGAVPLPKPGRGEAFDERFDRFVQFFVPELGSKYARVDFALGEAPEAVKVERTEVSVDGKPVAAWRTSKHRTGPAGFVNKPGSVLTAEIAFVGDEASNSCLYLASVSKMGSLTLDQLLPSLSIRKTPAAHATGHRVQLLDISEGAGENYPVRLATYEAAPGFSPSLASVRLREELVYAEDRLDDKGRVTATWRITHRDHAPTTTMAAEVEKETSAAGGRNPRVVELGTAGARASVFTAKAKVGDRAGVANTAVVEFEDKLWKLTWTTFGDEAAVKADQAAFETLLRGFTLATR